MVRMRKRQHRIAAPSRGAEWGGEDFVELEGYLVPPRAEFRYSGSDDEPDVTVQVRVENGQAYLSGFTIAARDARSQITDSDLRIPANQSVENWVKGIIGNLPVVARMNADGSSTDERRSDTLYTELRAATARSRRRAEGEQKRAHLMEVAQAYREGGRRGALAVAEEFGCKPRTAQLWIKQAREAGLLGPALPGRAGEA